MLLVIKAREFPIGTVRKQGGVAKRKVAKGKWVPVKKIKAFKGEESKKKDATYFWKKRTIPEGSYVHGGSSDILNVGHVLFGSKSWEIAEAYKHQHNGALWMFTINKGTKLFDVGLSSNLRSLRKKLWDDYHKGKLDMYSDLSSYLDYVDTPEELDDSLNPEDIVDSAGFWDVPSFVEWFYDTYEKDAVVTDDGIVVINPEKMDVSKVNE